jgi:hypothetical protein
MINRDFDFPKSKFFSLPLKNMDLGKSMSRWARDFDFPKSKFFHFFFESLKNRGLGKVHVPKVYKKVNPAQFIYQ